MRGSYVAADSTHVYWTDLGKPSGAPGQIGRLPIAGGTEQILATSLQQPNSAWLFGGRIFFAESITVPAPGNGTANSLPIGGGSVERLSNEPAYYVAASSTRACWSIGTAIRCRKEGAITTLVSGEAARITYLAIDENHAFFALATGALRRVAFDGTAPVTIDTAAKEIQFSSDIALDATHVYWVAATDVRKIAKAGGPANVLRRGTSGTHAVGLAADATHVYWTSWPDNTVSMLPK